MRNSLYTICLVALMSNMLWLAPATAQERNGTLTGTAKDSGGLALQGALVQLDPGGKRAVSDNQGQFRITDVAPGDYMVTVSYVGFAPFTKSVSVAAGQTANLDAQVEVASVADQVLVTAERLQGEAEAINIERTADNIVQVLPARVITSLPNTNIADAVGRLPSVTLERDEGEGKYVQIRGTEPRLSNVTINGVHVPSPEAGVRNIKLDAVPSEIVDRIEVFKTLLPNQEGDAIGGSVNLVTKTPLERPTVDLGTQGGYTPIQGGRWLSNASATLGERFGKNKNLGILFGGTFDHNDRGIDDLEPSQAIGTNPADGSKFAYINGEDLRTYQYNRSRYGWNLDLDYSFRPGSVIYFRGLYADFHDFGSVYVYTPNSGAIVSHTGDQTTFDNTGNMVYREYIRRPDQGVYSYQGGGTHSLTSTVIIYDFAVSRGHNYTGQDFPTTYFNGPSNVVFNLNESNPQIPKLMPVGTNIYDPTTYSLASTDLTHYRSVELDYEGSASLARNYSTGKHFSTFEMGFLFRHAHKTEDENDQYYNPTGNFPMSQVLGNVTNPTYYGGPFGPYGPTTNYANIQSLVASNLQTGFTPNISKDRITSDGATWGTTERVYAGYLMDSISFGKLRLVGGLRIEGTGTDFNANQLNLSGSAWVSTTPVTGNAGYVNLLPSLQATYLLGGNTNLRLSYSRGISRPNFSDIVPSVQADPNTSPKSLTKGNPDLVATRANMYDILVEHYFQPLGILQGGFFYKALTDPIYPTVSFVSASDPNFPGYLVQQSINGPSAHIAGVEMAWQQRLSFLPGLLNGIGVAANYSYTTSRVTFPDGFSSTVPGGQGRIDHPSLQRQAPNTWNLGLTYDKRRFSMRFAVSHNDENIYAYGYVHDPTNPNGDKDPIVGLRGPLADQYLYAHTQVDVQGSYLMYKGLSLVVAGLNLTNEVFGFYTGSPIYPNQREFYKPTVIFGMRWSSAPLESK
ncbi:MAG TPA: TonB-dependent receptor [Bryobacteraceae bacterium]|nr:TonB-dependent receptor [Bryobacteraceae bacterium]